MSKMVGKSVLFASTPVLHGAHAPAARWRDLLSGANVGEDYAIFVDASDLGCSAFPGTVPSKVLTEQDLRLDQAVAQIHELKRELSESRMQYFQDMALVRAQMVSLRRDLTELVMMTGVSSARKVDAERAEEISEQLRNALVGELGAAFADLTHRIVFDQDLGGEVAELSIFVRCDKEQFKAARERVLRVYDSIIANVDASAFVPLVRRRAA